MTGPEYHSTEAEAGPPTPGPDAHDLPDQLAAQRAWLALLRGEPDPGPPLTARQWTFLADEATRHRLRGLTYRLLEDGPLATQVPGEVRQRLRPLYLATATRNALLFRQTGQLVRELDARGIPVMLLKGIHLARFVYAEPGLRSMADVDLMVQRDQLREAEQVFLDCGYGPHPRPDLAEWCTWSNHLAKLEQAGSPVVELHWTIERPTSPLRIDLEGLWQRSEAATLDGAPVRLLAREDLLLHLALHLSYHHRFGRSALKGVVDIATLIGAEGNRIDWEALAERAIAWGASGYLYTTLRLATDILAAPVPPSLFRALPHRPADEEIVEVARRYILMLHVALPGVYLKLARGGTLAERGKLLLDALFLPRRKMEAVYRLRPGSPLVYPYYGLRLASLLAKRSRLLLHTLFRTPVIQPVIDRDQDRLTLERWDAAPPG